MVGTRRRNFSGCRFYVIVSSNVTMLNTVDLPDEDMAEVEAKGMRHSYGARDVRHVSAFTAKPTVLSAEEAALV